MTITWRNSFFFFFLPRFEEVRNANDPKTRREAFGIRRLAMNIEGNRRVKDENTLQKKLPRKCRQVPSNVHGRRVCTGHVASRMSLQTFGIVPRRWGRGSVLLIIHFRRYTISVPSRGRNEIGPCREYLGQLSSPLLVAFEGRAGETIALRTRPELEFTLVMRKQKKA